MSKTECPKHVQNSWTYIAFFFFFTLEVHDHGPHHCLFEKPEEKSA